MKLSNRWLQRPGRPPALRAWSPSPIPVLLDAVRPATARQARLAGSGHPVPLYLFFIPAQTWLVPLHGSLAERFGPKKLLLIAEWSPLAGSSTPQPRPLEVLSCGQVLAGCGSGIVYSISMGNALKWFPDRRAGDRPDGRGVRRGRGSDSSACPIWVIQHHGYEQAFLWFGLGQGLVVLTRRGGPAVSQAGRGAGPPHNPGFLQSGRDHAPGEMLRSPGFWLVYVMMMLGAIPGLVARYIAPMAVDFGVAERSVTLLWFTSAALPLAMQLASVMGGLTRPCSVGSRLHRRETAIFLAFATSTASRCCCSFNFPPTDHVRPDVRPALFGWGPYSAFSRP